MGGADLARRPGQQDDPLILLPLQSAVRDGTGPARGAGEHCRRGQHLQRPADGPDEQSLQFRAIDPDDLAATVGTFEPIWSALTYAEQAQVAALLIERVTYDGQRAELEIVFREEAVHAREG